MAFSTKLLNPVEPLHKPLSNPDLLKPVKHYEQVGNFIKPGKNLQGRLKLSRNAHVKNNHEPGETPQHLVTV